MYIKRILETLYPACHQDHHRSPHMHHAVKVLLKGLRFHHFHFRWYCAVLALGTVILGFVLILRNRDWKEEPSRRCVFCPFQDQSISLLDWTKQTQYWGYSHCFLIQSFLICRRRREGRRVGKED
jgi:hypothetical protein